MGLFFFSSTEITSAAPYREEPPRGRRAATNSATNTFERARASRWQWSRSPQLVFIPTPRTPDCGGNSLRQLQTSTARLRTCFQFDFFFFPFCVLTYTITVFGSVVDVFTTAYGTTGISFLSFLPFSSTPPPITPNTVATVTRGHNPVVDFPRSRFGTVRGDDTFGTLAAVLRAYINIVL